jgi:UDP-N-acetylmuramate: L-alanyl-gamma-D-glutamyl-meso-diaminopimelate ligase
MHQDRYMEAFDAANSVLLAPLGRTNLSPEERLDVDRLAQDLTKRGKPATAYGGVEAIVAALVRETQPGDVVALLSNGAFGDIHTKLKVALSERTTTA